MQANNVTGLAYSIAKDYIQAFDYCKKSIDKQPRCQFELQNA
jgi:hypothetical protein